MHPAGYIKHSRENIFIKLQIKLTFCLIMKSDETIEQVGTQISFFLTEKKVCTEIHMKHFFL